MGGGLAEGGGGDCSVGCTYGFGCIDGGVVMAFLELRMCGALIFAQGGLAATRGVRYRLLQCVGKGRADQTLQ